jgi:hypothetical protein
MRWHRIGQIGRFRLIARSASRRKSETGRQENGVVVIVRQVSGRIVELEPKPWHRRRARPFGKQTLGPRLLISTISRFVQTRGAQAARKVVVTFSQKDHPYPAAPQNLEGIGHDRYSSIKL